MSSLTVALIVLGCVFGSIILGSFLRRVMPERHLDGESKDIVKLATGLIATLSALVLGLLVSASRDSFNDVNAELMRMAVRVVHLDRILAQYGPDAKEIRDLVKSDYTAEAELILSGDESQEMKLDSPVAVARLESIQAKLRKLSPHTEGERGLQTRALEIADDVSSSRWLLMMESTASASTPLLVVLVFWLSIVFTAWSVFAPRNLIVTTALLACALSVAGAIFLILDMDSPFTGLIKVSSSPVRQAISNLGQ